MTITAKYSCVVDDKPLFKMQAVNWLATLLSSNTARAEDAILHFVEHQDSGLSRFAERLGAMVRHTQRFGRGEEAYCNKLMQLDCRQFTEADCVVLCDTDIAFAESLQPWLSKDVIRAKVVDLPNPPLETLQDLYKASRIAASPDVVKTPFADQSTFSRNCNGGLYIIPTSLLPALAPRWTWWARFALDQSAILGKYRLHADQLGFCLAMLELGLPFEPLPDEANFPIHHPLEAYADKHDVSPKVLHYHSRMDASGCLSPLGIERIDASIQRVNDAIRQSRHAHFDNGIFWEFRYSTNPHLGSGLGSRGDHLHYKRSILYPVVATFKERSILDLGCGDLEVMRDAEAASYTGIDLSKEAIALAEGKRPDWTFLAGDIAQVRGRQFDLVMCHDVLIHIPAPSAYRSLVSQLVDACSDTLIITAFNKPPSITSEITYYHEPLSTTLQKDGRLGPLQTIGSYRDLEIVKARRRECLPPNPWDITSELLAQGVPRTRYPRQLQELVELSRQKLGFFTRTSTRMIEYPWIVANAGDVSGLRVLDIGAGVCPVPLWLSAHGASVVTVDGHPSKRTIESWAEWNEWGFLDYSTIDSTIVSFNATFPDMPCEDAFDMIYSVSVIEHVPGRLRRELFVHTSQLLKPEGQLLLTLDLVPETQDLWNLSEGQVVEKAKHHGTLEDIRHELEHCGFRLETVEVEKHIPNSRTDIACIKARKVAVPHRHWPQDGLRAKLRRLLLRRADLC